MKSKTNLRTIPGVGKSIEQDLIELGYKKVYDLKGADPRPQKAQVVTMVVGNRSLQFSLREETL